MKKQFFSNLPLAVSILTTLAIASTEAAAWAGLFSLLFIIWRFFHEKFGIYKLSPKITPIFGFLFFVIVYIQHRTIFGQEESITILMGLTAITILNFETERDLLFMVLLGFLMVVLKSVFSLDFVWVVPALISYFGLWVSLMSNTKVNRYKFLLRTTLRSIPTLVVLFIFFPRFVLFQTNKALNSPNVQSGFSEEMSPGRFSGIGLSDEMVFRAQFVGLDKVDGAQLYWRGAVLNRANGFTWTKSSNEKKTEQYLPTEHKSVVKYRIVMEPSSVRNVFLLDKVKRIKNSTEPIVEWKHRQFSLVANTTQLIQVEAEAYFDEDLESLDDPVDSPKYLQVTGLGPRTLEWVENVKSKYPDQQARLKHLIAFFEKPGFIYTLKPDFYNNNLDDFLFVKKKGYCEHYAAAFASMARALEIPSRVVIGYQGGLYNALSDFWKISQRDAHAWVEVGISGAWKRVDPTGLVTPLRMTLGSNEFFALSEVDQMLLSKNKAAQKTSTLRSMYLAAYQVFDSLNYTWTMFLLNYDLQAQLELLKGVHYSWIYAVFAVIVVAILGVYVIRSRRERRGERHPLYALICEIENWARLHRVVFNESTPPLQVLDLIGQKYPKTAEYLGSLKRHYESVVYREEKSDMNVNELKKNWKKVSAERG